jgi:hypothetical protein
MNRFKMSFSNSGSIPTQYYNLVSSNISAKPMQNYKSTALNAPMVDRVHKAKPGCGACGKKVM